MKSELITVVCTLGLVAGQYHIPTVIVDTPTNSVCPSKSHIDAIRSQITRKISNVLVQTCGNPSYGWKRVAFLNMTDPNQTCPDAWRLYQYNSVSACGRQQGGPSCYSVEYDSESYVYSNVCGRITGYQYSSPDAGNHVSFNPTPGNAINEPYVDGVSITYGNPRQHIWSFYGSFNSQACCDALHMSNVESLGFIGNNSFCDTGNPTDQPWQGTHFTEHPLWDGINRCAGSTTCCTLHPGPWFTTSLPLPTMDAIEVRICGDQNTNNEDTPITLIEIYVK